MTNIEYKNIGERIKKLRTSAGLSQEKFAEKVGVSSVYVSYVECGKRKIGLEKLISISKVLNTTPDYLLFDNPKKGVEHKQFGNCTSEEIRFLTMVLIAFRQTVLKVDRK